jgi:hypothetical protein
MGLAKWAADKIKPRGKKVEKKGSESRIIRKVSPFRELQIRIPAGATRTDFVKVFEGLVENGSLTIEEVNERPNGIRAHVKEKTKSVLGNKGLKLDLPADVERHDLLKTLKDMIENGAVSSDLVNEQINKLSDGIAEKVKVAAEMEKIFPVEQQETLLIKLKERFEVNIKYHKKIKWSYVDRALRANPEKLWSLWKMDETGGEPDVIKENADEFIFGDCSKESPAGRRNVVYDSNAEQYLKKNNPKEKCNGNAVDMTASFRAELMDGELYNEMIFVRGGSLFNINFFEFETWSWLKGGFHSGNVIITSWGHDIHERFDHEEKGGFRTMLRVPKD